MKSLVLVMFFISITTFARYTRRTVVRGPVTVTLSTGNSIEPAEHPSGRAAFSRCSVRSKERVTASST